MYEVKTLQGDNSVASCAYQELPLPRVGNIKILDPSREMEREL